MNHFVALMLGAGLGEAVLDRTLPPLDALKSELPDDLRIHGAGDLHVTLAFVGPLEDGRVQPLVGDLRAALQEGAAPHLCLGATGAFPARGRERVLWAGVEELSSPGTLAGLAATVQEVCRDHGVPIEDRPFRPHVTLARVRAAARGAIPGAFYGQVPGLEWKPTAAWWVQSPGAGGSTAYRPTEGLPLGAPRSGALGG